MQRYKPSEGPVNYREQPGCETCGHVFNLYEHDESPRFFCHKDRSKRPKCGSVYMNERYPDRRSRVKAFDKWNALTSDQKSHELTLDGRSYGRHDNKWLDWSYPRAVAARGICDEWIPQEAD